MAVRRRGVQGRGLGEGRGSAGGGPAEGVRGSGKTELAKVELAKVDHSIGVQGLGFLVLGSRFTVSGCSGFRVREGNLDETVCG